MARAALTNRNVFSTSRTFLSIGDWSELLATLRRAGFSITLDREARVAALLWRLTEVGVTLRDHTTVADYLAPVLCITADDRARFEEICKDHFVNHARGEEGSGKNTQSSVPAPTKFDRQFFVLFVALLIAVIVIVLWFFVFSDMSPKVRGGAEGGSDSEPAPVPSMGRVVLDLITRFVVAAPALFLAAAVLAWRRDERAMLVRKAGHTDLEKNYRVPFDRSGLFRDRTSRNAFFLLKRASRVTSGKINVTRSMKATVAAGGWPAMYYVQYLTNIELVIFADRGQDRDHIGLLADTLVDRLRAVDAFITRYDYRIHPGRLTLTSGRGEGPPDQDLARIAHRHTGHRLLLLTDAEGLFRRGSTSLDPLLLRELSHFGQIVVITPTPPEAWGERERKLGASGFVVVPATEDGLDRATGVALGETDEVVKKIQRDIPNGFDPFLLQLDRNYHRFSSDHAPPADEIADLVIGLSVWMQSRSGFKVLAAAAAFPWLEPGLTLAFGARVLRAPVDPELFARIARLPWMRDARMPDWLRIALVNHLPEQDRREIANCITEVLADANSRPEGNPFSAAELATLPIARENAAADFFANADPSELGDLAERVFLSFLKGERLDPANPLTPEATDAMKNEVGAGFERYRLPFAAVAAAVTILLFLFKDPLGVLYLNIEAGLARFTSGLLPNAELVFACRGAALICVTIAFASWAWSTMRIPEVAAADHIRASLPLQWPRVFPFSWDAGPFRSIRLTWTRQTDWLALALLGAMLALAALEKEEFVGRLTLVASLLAVAWMIWVRRIVAGAATTVVIDYDSLQVRDPQDRSAPKPGGLSAYPLGRAIARGGWLGPTLIAVVAMLPVSAGVSAGITTAVSDRTGQAVIVGTFLAVAGWSATLSLMRRIILGVWNLPERSWSKPLSQLSDIFFAAALTTPLMAGISLVVSSPDLALPTLFIIVPMGVIAVLLSIPLIGLRSRLSGPKLRVKLLLASVSVGIVAEITALTLTAGSVWAIVLLLVFPATVVAINYLVTRSAFHLLDPETTRTVRRAAFRTAALCFVLFLVMFFIGGVSIFMVGAIIGLFRPFLPVIGLFESDPGAAAAIFALVSITHVSLLYPVWRYVGPAAVAIEGLKAEGRLKLPPEVAKTLPPVPQSRGSAIWELPWAAFPLIAIFGIFPVFSPLQELTPLALPVAVFFAARHGQAAFLPIVLGTLPFWIAAWPGSVVGSAGGAWFALVIIFWANFVMSGEARRRLLQREQLAWSDVAIICLLLSASLTASVSTPLGQFALAIDPTPMLLTVAVVVGASRMPRERLACGLVLMGVVWLLSREFVTDFTAEARVTFGAAPLTAITALLCLDWIDGYRRELRAGVQSNAPRRLLRRARAANPDRALIQILILAFAFVGQSIATGGIQIDIRNSFVIAVVGFYGGLCLQRATDWRSLLALLARSSLICFVALVAGVGITLAAQESGVRILGATDIAHSTLQLATVAIYVSFAAFGNVVRYISDDAAGASAPPQDRTEAKASQFTSRAA